MLGFLIGVIGVIAVVGFFRRGRRMAWAYHRAGGEGCQGRFSEFRKNRGIRDYDGGRADL